jgi:hypothetical protein
VNGAYFVASVAKTNLNHCCLLHDDLLSSFVYSKNGGEIFSQTSIAFTDLHGVISQKIKLS